MIMTWLVELYLNQLGELRDGRQAGSATYKQLQEEFQNFLKSSAVYECVSNNSSTIYDLMSSHGDQDSLTEFAELINGKSQVSLWIMVSSSVSFG